MRRVCLSLSLLLLSGCGRWVGYGAARREVVNDALREQRFPMGAEEAALLIRRQVPVTTRCDRMPSGEVRCGGCLRNRCFELIEEQGLTRVATQADHPDAELMALWQPLDGSSLATFREQLDDLVEDKLIDQERSFEPRWGITGGVFSGFATDFTSPNFGVRLGARRWFDVHLIGHAAFEYRFRGDHEVNVRAGLEIARWTEGRLLGAIGAPPASVSFFIGPLFRFPIFRPALRTGLGFHVTDLRSVPFFLEIAAETTFAGESSRVAASFTLGVGI